MQALEYLSEARSILDNIKEGDLAYPFARYSDVEISELQQVRMHRLTGEVHEDSCIQGSNAKLITDWAQDKQIMIMSSFLLDSISSRENFGGRGEF